MDLSVRWSVLKKGRREGRFEWTSTGHRNFIPVGKRSHVQPQPPGRNLKTEGNSLTLGENRKGSEWTPKVRRGRELKKGYLHGRISASSLSSTKPQFQGRWIGDVLSGVGGRWLWRDRFRSY